MSRPLLLAALMAAPDTAWAQTPTQAPHIRQEVIVTGTLVDADARLFGRAVTVITADDLARLGIRSAIDALRLVPGIDVRARGPRDVQTDFSVRGATFGQQLVLVDGWRLNDSQSGHHNGDIPVPVAALDRIEVVGGGASSTHGGDALGGTLNFITRGDAHAVATASAGEHGFVDAQVSVGGGRLPDGWAIAGWASRSSGFAFDRDFAIGGASLRAALSRVWRVDVRHQRKAFGANGFYGPSPSKEWTDQTLAGVEGRFSTAAWVTRVALSARNHGDHFRWDIARPGFAENRHRTNAVQAGATTTRTVGADARLAAGGSVGGDWVRSSNLGDRNYARGAAFAELQWTPGARTAIQSALRVDAYSTFGASVSPAISAAVRLSETLSARTSVARAFRVPTFTERYYSDPSNLGTPDLRAEHGWSYDAGLDWASRTWRASATAFRRWDDDVIDWVRATPADRWRSANVRDVASTGVELSASQRWKRLFGRVAYTHLEVDAPSLHLLSKYVLEYARDQIGVSIASSLGAGFSVALNADRRHRADGQRYTLIGARVARDFGRVQAFVDASNLLDRRYVEVPGVSMPGRWITAGVTLASKPASGR